MTLLCDFADVPEEHHNCCFEGLYKAMAETPDGDDRSIWAPHDNPYLAAHVEAWSARMGALLQALQDALAHLLGGHAVGDMVKADVPWLRWSPAQFEAVRTLLESRAPSTFTLEDWMLVVDWLIQRYLPAGVISTEAEYLTVRAALLGKLEAAMQGAPPAAGDLSAWETLTPTSFAEVPPRVLAPIEVSILKVATSRAAVNIGSITEAARARMKAIVIEHVQAQVLGQKEGRYTALQTRLFDEFAILNKDMRKVAVTEAGECCNQGVIAAQQPGARVKRKEAYRGACGFCKSIDGRIFTVIDPSTPVKNGETEVWLGKTNVGRSASPRMRMGETLVERPPSQRWWPAAGAQHPHCFVSGLIPVYTSNGWKPIGQIEIGDSVLTHMGRFRPVTWVLTGVHHTGPVYGAVASYGGRNQKTLPSSTGEHPILTARGWQPSADLVPGDRLVALAKVCPTCGETFVNAKFPHVQTCSNACSPRLGRNQFSSENPDRVAQAKMVTGEANRKRMQSLTVEQRAALTAGGRAVMAVRGYEHLTSARNLSIASRSAATNNYRPSPLETFISKKLSDLGFENKLQFRVQQHRSNPTGKTRYWWLDIALPDQRLAIEIDGEPWHGRLSDGRDVARDEDLKALGWDVLRFPADQAKRDPASVAAAIARVAMNHSSAYLFDHLQVERVFSRKVTNAQLFNFAVQDDESYIIAGGFVVHNCRGSWLPLPGMPPNLSPEFVRFMAAMRAGRSALPARPSS